MKEQRQYVLVMFLCTRKGIEGIIQVCNFQPYTIQIFLNEDYSSISRIIRIFWTTIFLVVKMVSQLPAYITAIHYNLLAIFSKFLYWSYFLFPFFFSPADVYLIH